MDGVHDDGDRQRRDQAALLDLLEADGAMVLDALDRWVATDGERTFLTYGEDDVVVSFAEFGRLTDTLAGNLARLGVGKGQRVSLFLRNPLVTSLWMFGASGRRARSSARSTSATPGGCSATSSTTPGRRCW